MFCFVLIASLVVLGPNSCVVFAATQIQGRIERVSCPSPLHCTPWFIACLGVGSALPFSRLLTSDLIDNRSNPLRRRTKCDARCRRLQNGGTQEVVETRVASERQGGGGVGIGGSGGGGAVSYTHLTLPTICSV